MNDSEEDIFLTQSSFNGSINSDNDLDYLLEDYQNAQFNIEEATEGLFSFNQADKYEEVSIGSVDKEVGFVCQESLECTDPVHCSSINSCCKKWGQRFFADGSGTIINYY